MEIMFALFLWRNGIYNLIGGLVLWFILYYWFTIFFELSVLLFICYQLAMLLEVSIMSMSMCCLEGWILSWLFDTCKSCG